MSPGERVERGGGERVERGGERVERGGGRRKTGLSNRYF